MMSETHQRSFDRGDLVYKLDTSTQKSESKKLKPVWIGPLWWLRSYYQSSIALKAVEKLV